MSVFSGLMTGGLSVFLTGLGLVGWVAGGSFNLDVIPWLSGPTLVKVLFFFGLAGIASVALAAKGLSALPQLVWNLISFGTMAYGFFVSNYKFDDADHFKNALQLTSANGASAVGALMAALRARKS